jgi:ABC-type dipeptide/oligopeptide/nickel transport system permease subunit
MPAANRAFSPFYFLGADEYGRDNFSRLIYGAASACRLDWSRLRSRLSSAVTIGGISGYCGGAIDSLIQRVIEIVNAFPQIPLWLAFGYALPIQLAAALHLFRDYDCVEFARMDGAGARGARKILSLREGGLCDAARLLGASQRGSVPTFAAGIHEPHYCRPDDECAAMILGETSLSFLVLGIAPARGELGRDVERLPGQWHPDGGELSVAPDAGCANRVDGPLLQLSRRRFAGCADPYAEKSEGRRGGRKLRRITHAMVARSCDV